MADCLIDSGNTRIKFARYESGQWQAIGIVDFDDTMFVNRCLEIIDAGHFQKIIYASVSKGFRAERFAQLLESIHLPILPIETLSHMGRLQIAYANPEQLGVDRFLALLAASKQELACAILSLGSAVTLDVLGADGVHRGGIIAPSPEFQWKAMREHFPGLFESQGQPQMLANNTLDGLASGVEHQLLGMVERVMADSFRAQDAKLWVTGGGAQDWLECLPVYSEHAPEILFNGMVRYIELSGL